MMLKYYFTTFIIFPIFEATLANYEPLNILFLSGYGPLPYPLQSQLQASFKWFQKSIRADAFEKPTTLHDLQKASPIFQSFSHIFVQNSQFESNLHINDPKFSIMLKTSNFIIFLEKDQKQCESDEVLLATAQPIGNIQRDKRPRFGRMRVCSQTNKFSNYYDLFRHEVLHALGYGMYNPSAKINVAPETEFYNWKTPEGTQKANRTYLDFYKTALAAARSHFNCPSLSGIESDGTTRNHLNEYIFGNELMTPTLEEGPNYFSLISAGVIEDTHNGNRKWYIVDRKFIAEEAAKYWYGKNLGCVFLTKSCYEFVNSARSSTFPICSDLNTKYCLVFPQNKQRIRLNGKAQCESRSRRIPSYQMADNGVMGTNGNVITRFCPFDQAYNNLPTSFEIVPC